MLWCPDLICGADVGQDMINAFVSGEDKVKYSRYLLRSYIEDNRKAPHLDHAIEAREAERDDDEDENLCIHDD
ncbi:hypothetical protein Taro_020439 [Colocasia esculenta]|uniref:Uncharacterized protein n=1 Tax=Colocasia esculenta TaxID=4460 RepID=A0A843UWF7_COLES|nr:hypothetical protein [Colocasia esculenta]